MIALPLHEKIASDAFDEDERPRRATPARLAILFLLVLGIVRVALFDPFGVASLMNTDRTVTHIVMFQFRDGVSRDVMAEVRSLSPFPNPCAMRPQLLTSPALGCIANVCAQGRLRASVHGRALHQQRDG